jgi:hypothetical protein
VAVVQAADRNNGTEDLAFARSRPGEIQEMTPVRRAQDRHDGDDRERSMTPDQCRAARALIGLSRHELAIAAEIWPTKILAFEVGMVRLSDAERRTLRGVLELAGVEFADDHVRLHRVALTGAISAGL